MEHLSVPSGHFLPPARLEAFSDGVFSIAITLLILDLHVPQSPDRLLSQLASEWPSFLGYLVSFAFIGGAWLAHTALTHMMRLTDGVVVGLNLLQLLFVSFLPFSTSVLTKHLTGPAEHVAVMLFGLNLTLSMLVSTVMVGYVARMDELKSNVDPVKVAWLERQRRGSVTLFGLTTALSGFFPRIAVGFYLLLSLLLIGQPIWQLRQRLSARRRRVESGEGT